MTRVNTSARFPTGLAALCLLLVTSDSIAGASRTRLAIVDGRWHLNHQVTYRGSKAEGLLLNVRMVNSTFEDASRPEFNPEQNTDEFIAQLDDYVAHGVRALTLNLQGGMPGYEGANNSAFNPDGSLRAAYLQRVRRVIEACDRQGVAVILGCYYQRQDQVLAKEDAVRSGVVNTVQWLKANRFRHVALEIANEFGHGGFDHAILKRPEGQIELLQLAKRSWPALLVSTSGMGDGAVPEGVARACDFLLVHFNSTPLAEIPQRLAALKRYGKPIVCNEDQKSGEAGAKAAELCVANGASWGLMLEKRNQHFPFAFHGAADDPRVYATFRRLTAPEPAPDEPARVQQGLRDFLNRTARRDGSFANGIVPQYRGMSDSAYSDLAAVTYAVTLHKTFGWPLPHEDATRRWLLERQLPNGDFLNRAGTVAPKSAEGRVYNTTQALVALRALGAKPRFEPLRVFEEILQQDYKTLPAYSTSFFPLAYLAYGQPIPPEADRRIRATMTQAPDGYLNNHIAATFHAVHYHRLLGEPTPLADKIVERVLREQKPDGSWLLNMPSRDRHATFDAVFTLRQLAPDRAECRAAIQRAARWVLSCRHPDGGFGHFPGSTSDADANYFQAGTLVMAGFLEPAVPRPPDSALLSWGHLMPIPNPAADNPRARR
jgi:prenyltransferase beta subunit